MKSSHHEIDDGQTPHDDDRYSHQSSEAMAYNGIHLGNSALSGQMNRQTELDSCLEVARMYTWLLESVTADIKRQFPSRGKGFIEMMVKRTMASKHPTVLNTLQWALSVLESKHRSRVRSGLPSLSERQFAGK